MKKPCWIVTDVHPHTDYTMTVTFITGEKKLFDMRPELEFPIYSPLKNIGLFMQAHVAFNTVVWNDDIDIAPESLYKESIPVGDTNDQRMCANH